MGIVVGHPVQNWIVGVALGVYAGLWAHELSHWTIGKLGCSDPKIVYKYWVFPSRVKHLNIGAVDDLIIRFSGAAPFIWIPTGLFTLVWFLSINTSPVGLLLTLITCSVPLGSTESDQLAFCSPDDFRSRDKNDDLSPKLLLRVFLLG